MNHLWKKGLSILLILGMLFLLSCGKGEEKPKDPPESTGESATLTQTEPPSASEPEPSPPVSTEEEEVETLTEDYFDPLRPDFNLNECRKLAGDVTVAVFFLNDDTSTWGKAEIEEYTELGIRQGLRYLEEQAARYGVTLRFHTEIFPVMSYRGSVLYDPHGTGLVSDDVLKQCAANLGLESDRALVSTLSEQCGGREVICLTVFCRNGSSYAINPSRSSQAQTAEHCVLFRKDLTALPTDPPRAQASIAMHELLHLYGAEDFYRDAKRSALAEVLYPTDLMLNVRFDIANNTVGDVTAYYVGWLGEAPSVLSDPDW